jgi:hypothetical protein
MQRDRSVVTWGAALVLAVLLTPSRASAIPAFARKHGLSCAACHEAWPMLNDFGRAYRDNGYQLLQGKDTPTTSEPGYLPLSIRLTPHYEFTSTTNQPTDQGAKTLTSGHVADIGLDLLLAGTLFDNVSFLVVPTGFVSEGGVTLESAWVRFSNLADSSWLNLKLGKHEVDLPQSAHRPWSLSPTGYLVYSYHSPGAISTFDLGENQPGVEWVGHDRGSFTRAAISVFTVSGSPGSHGAFDTPGVYGHLTHRWLFDGAGLTAFELGGFGTATMWPAGALTQGGQPIAGQGSDLKRSSKVGVDAHLLFGPRETPLHLITVFAYGQDDKALIPLATRDGTFSGGFVEAGYTPVLRTTVFARYDMIRNLTQGVPDTSQHLNDEDAETVGLRHTFNLTDRAAYTLHAEVSTLRKQLAAADGADVRTNTLFLGIDFGF